MIFASYFTSVSLKKKIHIIPGTVSFIMFRKNISLTAATVSRIQFNNEEKRLK